MDNAKINDDFLDVKKVSVNQPGSNSRDDSYPCVICCRD